MFQMDATDSDGTITPSGTGGLEIGPQDIAGYFDRIIHV